MPVHAISGRTSITPRALGIIAAHWIAAAGGAVQDVVAANRFPCVRERAVSHEILPSRDPQHSTPRPAAATNCNGKALDDDYQTRATPGIAYDASPGADWRQPA
jgi:hypothetical protein